MSFIRYSVLAVAVPFALVAGAQSITLAAPGNVPVPGASFTVHRGAYVAPPAAGAAQTFDFSAFSATSTLNYQWRNPADLPNGGNFPGAQVALVNGGPDSIFYKATVAGLERVGDTRTINVLGTNYHLATVYTNSILDLKLPLAHGDAPWTDLFQGALTVDGNTTNRSGAITGEADAWGNIVLPGGATAQVLRVTTSVTETIPLTTSLGVVSVNHVYHESAYYPLWGKFPVLRMVSDTLSTTVPVALSIPTAYTEWLGGDALGMEAYAPAALAAQVFPNPASEQATLVVRNTASTPMDVRVVDVRGAVVLRMQTNKQVLDLDVRGLDAGIYQVVITGQEGQRGLGRLVVAR